MPEWGWTSYKKLGWAKEENGTTKRYYEAHFRTDGSGNVLTYSQTVRFWASRPLLAIRTIANSGQEPINFYDKTIN